MYPPRIVQPEDEVLVTSRVLGRQYLLRPDPIMRTAFAFLLGYYARKHGIVLYAACLMSTHYHVVLRDTKARRSAFIRDLNSTLAGFVRAYRGTRGPLFSPRPSQVRLKTPQSVVDKIAYTLANPVAAGAVAQPKKWPGVLCTAKNLGTQSTEHCRPKCYFRTNGTLEESTTLHFELPQTLVEQHGEEGARQLIIERVTGHVKSAIAELRKKGWQIQGLKRALQISPFHRATSYEVFGSLNPEFATLGGGIEALRRAVEELRNFRAAYYQALYRYRCGDHQAEFPFGTYKMAWLFQVRTAPAPT
ncbi:MAG: hypothetical protein AAF355_14810 [Myxococcota bacterium]